MHIVLFVLALFVLDVQLDQDVLVCLTELADPLLQVCVERLALLVRLFVRLLFWECQLGGGETWNYTVAQFGVSFSQFTSGPDVGLELQHDADFSV